ncbi:DUF2946 family protein [Cognatilysobacter terrigena]|uniref:DUF2946 family protein n=1 Tax=Cognatilysobacter terrigena TaxID=2488749 RepID=UPI001414D2DE|nr:DUF2946 family protein [Lysobacter terrigena]
MSPALRRRFALLAVTAALLLALLPTIGRLGAGTVACESGMPASHAMPAMSMSMHHMAGMTPEQHRAHMAMMARMASRDAAPARVPTPAHDSHDCPYCPLLSGLVGATTLPWSPSAPLALAPWSVRAVAQRATDAPVPALGGQGPPSVLTS